ncbi:MAG TPA: hydantoinase/oxoprolinase family protein [Actinomycetota bacterium]|jgi:N-methylhydantoinase A|nr:hydantoinase/oxoprolinase family protein [Actinomycetota bacterium]
MRAEQSPVALAIDIGGTFTDLAAVDARTGELLLAKADSTPTRLQQGVLSALERSGLEPRDVGAFVHGSTVVINAITERRGARTAVVTTEGFRDVLEIGRANRPDLYNLSYRKPEPFVPRRFRFEVRERISHRGEVLVPLDKVGVERIADHLRADIDAVAICFLHSWINPDHERRTAELLSKLLKGVEIVASHEVSTQWREYERTSTAVLSAYVKPTVADYLYDLRSGLRDAGIASPLYAMRSSGGVSSFERAVTAPITLLESGPVAGVTAAAELGRRLGTADVLTLDIGGTTAKTSAVRDGRVRIETLHHVERTPKTAGYPIQVPVVEIVEIGAGGGSIAWVDDAGGLHVGPRSAAADPGPACYGRGGADATVTDANLVAGRLDPNYFLGGTMPLDVGAAHRSLARLGQQLNVDAPSAARGVLRYVVAQMAHALRLVTLRRGHDPRDFTFVAFGGAGPLHAALLARELGVARTVIPPAPGHFSALGMLLGEFRADAVRTHVGPLDHAPLGRLFDALEREAAAELEEEAGERRINRFARLRYVGQEHTLEVPLGEGPIDDDLLARLRSDFDAASTETYAFSLPTAVEIVEARVSVSAARDESLEWTTPAASLPELRPREVDLDQHGGVQLANVVERRSLARGERLTGPCIVEEPATTVLVLPGQVVSVDDLSNLVIEETS